ncbi:WxL domain-containing protein [Cryobacterium sp. Y29]|uniref:WxL domain-containing protein n=1 Tax=Cryobacterium sp. Y29 TaxID=2048285 RepID=UPI000CE4B7C2|nr:WxL domain-containing protein [Cryobacterium sp. Y29]
MKKNLIATLAVAVLGASVLVASPAYASDGYTNSGIEYKIKNGAASVVDYDMGFGTVVVIPANISVGGTNYAVSQIENEAFNEGQITSVTFLGPPPTDMQENALAKSEQLVVLFPAEFGAPAYQDGFTTPTWKGYPARALSLPEEESRPQPGSAPTAATESEVMAAIVAGPRTASLSALELPTVQYSHEAQFVQGVATVSVNDLSGSKTGWSVTQQASDLTWRSITDGPANGVDLSAANLVIEARASVVAVAGQDWHVSPLIGGSLDEAVTVMAAPQGRGSGEYTAPLRFRLAIPAQAPVGTYSGTLTTTLAVAP